MSSFLFNTTLKYIDKKLTGKNFGLTCTAVPDCHVGFTLRTSLSKADNITDGRTPFQVSRNFDKRLRTSSLPFEK